MQIVAATIVRGTAQLGLEVEFRGEGGENVAIQLKSEEISSLSDEEVISRAKEMLAQVIASESNESDGSNAGPLAISLN
jgi:hypothetical protein